MFAAVVVIAVTVVVVAAVSVVVVVVIVVDRREEAGGVGWEATETSLAFGCDDIVFPFVDGLPSEFYV